MGVERGPGGLSMDVERGGWEALAMGVERVVGRS